MFTATDTHYGKPQSTFNFCSCRTSNPSQLFQVPLTFCCEQAQHCETWVPGEVTESTALGKLGLGALPPEIIVDMAKAHLPCANRWLPQFSPSKLHISPYSKPLSRLFSHSMYLQGLFMMFHAATFFLYCLNSIREPRVTWQKVPRVKVMGLRKMAGLGGSEDSCKVVRHGWKQPRSVPIWSWHSLLFEFRAPIWSWAEGRPHSSWGDQADMSGKCCISCTKITSLNAPCIFFQPESFHLINL